jgi:hypothetical protein
VNWRQRILRKTAVFRARRLAMRGFAAHALSRLDKTTPSYAGISLTNPPRVAFYRESVLQP